MTGKLSAEDLARRRPVWVALSDLFLDTDVRLSYVSIVAALAASPYSLEELRGILDSEVTPALQANLLSVAGEWAMFDEDWVVERVSSRVGKRRWLPNAVSVEKDWLVLAELIDLIRALPGEAARRERIEAWGELMPLLLSVRHHRSPEPAVCRRLGLAEARRIFREELTPRMMPGIRELARTTPSIYPSEADIEENWRRFETALLGN